MPVTAETKSEIPTMSGDNVAGINCCISNVAGHAMSRAMMPPSKQMHAASVMNCSMIVRRLAPIAFRTPISRVRSATDTNMMFMMPMPPTNKDKPVINNPMPPMVPAIL